ncbi:MAG: hypothetical protein QME96_00970, partial [Myxococcota bacterium]|nr:hypothetical protein [Myxococcota bacterium]
MYGSIAALYRPGPGTEATARPGRATGATVRTAVSPPDEPSAARGRLQGERPEAPEAGRTGRRFSEHLLGEAGDGRTDRRGGAGDSC